MPQKLVLAAMIVVSSMFAQAPMPDVVTFTNGERIVGKLLRSNGSSVTFHSDTLGDLTFDWNKVKELESSQAFAALPKNVQLKKHADTSAIPEGKIAVADQKLTVTPDTGAPKTVAIADTGNLIDKAGFENEVQHEPGFFRDWGGTITAGASLVQATQESRNFNTAIDLVRLVPDVDWLRRRNRTIVQFDAVYGTVKQPATPTVKTQIFHADLERDEYLSPALFAFGQGAFDHNFSQGLDLQQTFGGGLGWSAIKRANESLDLKAGITYERQSFTGAAKEQDLVGSVFEEDFGRGLRGGMKFTQQLIVMPSWNNSNAISAIGNALLTVPVYKRLNFSLGTIDNYLHDPPSGFKKNSFQVTMGLTYALR
jgi:putative salt-induced outer membrane protein YdiY